MHENRSRALGALYGLALGDALGMPTQSLPRAEIVARYGAVVGGFRPGPDGHPLAAGLPAGSVTDDTEQAVLLARLVVAGRRGAAAAASAAGRGHWTAGADVAARIAWATGLVAGLPRHHVPGTVYRLVGTSLATQESVPAAFAVAAAVPGDPWLACRLAASLGGDCDTIAAMTGAICGACHGAEAFPAAARETVARVNGLDFGPLADDLLAIRTPAHDQA